MFPLSAAKLFTSVTSHSAEDVDNLDRGVMAHEKHLVRTVFYSHNVVSINRDGHDSFSFLTENRILFPEVLLYKPNIYMWELESVVPVDWCKH